MTDSIKQILTAHAEKYPLMLPQDAVKLLFQNEFGGGHLIADSNATLNYLCTEYASVAHDPAQPLIEDIGNGMVRVMLHALDTGEYPLESLNEDFVRSAQIHTGNHEIFLHKLNCLKDLTHQGIFSFSPEALEEYLASYISSDCPPVSHSQTYRDAYHPSYRVICRSCLPPIPVLLHAIRQLKAPANRPLLIAIDGRCASGKTTLSKQLQAALECGVVHLDDFFLRPEQRTKERYETPGENVDHERFLKEVLLPLSQGTAAEYRPFDCSTQQLSEAVRLEPTSIIVAEGSFSCHSELWPYYDLRIFLTISPEKQMERIIKREGSEYADVFRAKWIPLEEAYFSAYQLESKCDFCFEC